MLSDSSLGWAFLCNYLSLQMFNQFTKVELQLCKELNIVIFADGENSLWELNNFPQIIVAG